MSEPFAPPIADIVKATAATFERAPGITSVSGSPGAPTNMLPTFYSQSSIDTTSLVLSSGSPYNRTLIYGLALNNVTAGEYIVCSAEQEFTNTQAYSVFIAGQIIVTATALSTLGTAVTPANGNDVTSLFHDRQMRSGYFFTNTSSYPVLYVYFVAYAAASGHAGATITVENGTGQLQVTRYTS